ncbi:hypothetical protein LARV_03685 [Longilinea arvoryzae]|uniref:Uncharacterized protein n=1 Tax=Longilinea arvoryzae TaxID=360412 RepID=A0A0S7BMG9_9CHLR|nr:hypothetical protein LARV_03685 [Longilinea arvoryzae]
MVDGRSKTAKNRQRLQIGLPAVLTERSVRESIHVERGYDGAIILGNDNPDAITPFGWDVLTGCMESTSLLTIPRRSSFTQTIIYFLIINNK